MNFLSSIKEFAVKLHWHVKKFALLLSVILNINYLERRKFYAILIALFLIVSFDIIYVFMVMNGNTSISGLIKIPNMPPEFTSDTTVMLPAILIFLAFIISPFCIYILLRDLRNLRSIDELRKIYKRNNESNNTMPPYIINLVEKKLINKKVILATAVSALGGVRLLEIDGFPLTQSMEAALLCFSVSAYMLIDAFMIKLGIIMHTYGSNATEAAEIIEIIRGEVKKGGGGGHLKGFYPPVVRETSQATDNIPLPVKTA